MNIGEYVVLNKDINKYIYVIKEIVEKKDKKYIIRGLNHRIVREASEKEISIASKEDIDKENITTKKYYFDIIGIQERKRNQKYLLGKILHIDGDEEYLNKCLQLYKELGIYAYGITITEKEMPIRIKEYLDNINPDIVVITGHDLYNEKGIKPLENYTNTKYFVETIKEIRKYKNDSCVIIAGACQSNYEALIASGANFASSPSRINIHTFDPAVIAIKASTTSFMSLIDIESIFKYIENGRKAFGGIQSFGKMKLML